MTLKELYSILTAAGFPVAYSHFNEPMDPPFICYLVAYSSNFHADDHVYKQVQNVQIELYTDKKDLDAEAKLETVLNANEISYQTTETYIETERLFQKIYEVGVILNG